MNFTQIPGRVRFSANQKNMADFTLKSPANIPGPFYVDETCIDCDMCREHAPAFLRRDDHLGLSYVYRQPTDPEEVAQFEEAIDLCPTESIGRDLQ